MLKARCAAALHRPLAPRLAPRLGRFDFSWNGPVGPEQLQRVEAQVNACIDAAQPVDALPVALEQAKFIYSLRSVFGEQYPDPVRVVSVGNNVSAMVDEPQNKDWAAGLPPRSAGAGEVAVVRGAHAAECATTQQSFLESWLWLWLWLWL